MKILLLLGAIVVALYVLANYERRPLPLEAKADLVRIYKSERRLVLMENGKELREYRIALGPAPVGHKQAQGDGRTPEGRYLIDFRKNNSAFHRALHVSYPNEHDISVAKAKGVDPGGAIMIHGMRNGLGWIGNLHHLSDWTAGCVAVTDREIDEIWRAVPDGTPVEIMP
jgi:murein L,D-transpeptidase YafK